MYLLDVTLRDGGYTNGFRYTEEEIERIVGYAQESADLVEVGYRKGSFAFIDGIGPSGLCEAPYLRCLKSLLKRPMVVICHPKNIGVRDVEEMASCDFRFSCS